MHSLMSFALICVCATLLIRVGESFSNENVISGSDNVTTQVERRQDGNSTVLQRKPSTTLTTAASNATRDSQLLNVLAARRRQLLQDRLTAHINTLANLSLKPLRTNTTFAQLEVRDANSTVLKRIVFDESVAKINKSALRVETISRSQPITKELVEAQDIKNLTTAKLFENTKIRAGFLNNRRKDVQEKKVDSLNTSSENEADEVRIHFKNDPLYYNITNNSDPDVITDPEEEFQVDESSHGVYLLNFTDDRNVTASTPKDASTEFIVRVIQDESDLANITSKNNTLQQNTTNLLDLTSEPSTTTVNYLNSTLSKLEITSNNTNENKTQFVPEKLYGLLDPLESELPAEDMMPFLEFGQKISPQTLSSNTSLLSASTKAYNYLNSAEKLKYTSRYSATEKNKNVYEEEINEDMDVAVVKNVIEKNKLRTSVKGTPPRHGNLVNAYRMLTSTTSQPKINNETDISTISPAQVFQQTVNSTAETTNIDVVVPKNSTRNNFRRRPSKFNPAEILRQESITTTEKSSTLVYTAVVTSVSITSSIKSQNKSDDSFNGTMKFESGLKSDVNSSTDSSSGTPEATTVSTVNVTIRPPRRYKTRIRTTTIKPSSNRTSQNPIPLTRKPSSFYLNASLDNINSSFHRLQKVELGSRITENNDTRDELQLAQQRREQILNHNLQRRRRPTTTTTTTTTASSILAPLSNKFEDELITSANSFPRDEITLRPIFVTTKVPTKNYNTESQTVEPSTESPTTQSITEKTGQNNTIIERNIITLVEEEIVIEADKNYTASYVLAGLGFLPVIAIIVYVLRNIYLKKSKEIDTEYEGYFEDDEVKKESPITPVTRMPSSAQLHKPDSKWEFPRSKLRLQTLLGQGNFGQVWKAEADDLTGHDGLTRLVAVKTIKETATQKEKQELLHEICVMQKIGIHPNVVTLLACCTEQEPYLLVMEYVMCGKLLTYLRERRSRPDRFGGSGALTSRDLTVFAYCVARGMDYLSSKGIVHRDLAARNVLVDHNKLCKIADFGMSRELGPNGGAPEGRPQRNALPVRWMAPEALLYNVYNHETDVWAYGILLWEIVTLGSTPYASMSGREVLQVVTEGYRLERPPHCKPQLYRTMYACWNADPTQRPPFPEIKSQLAELLENEPTEGNYVDLESFYQDSSVYSDPSAIIQDDGGISIEYSRELKMDSQRRSFNKTVKSQTGVHRNLSNGNYDARNFGFTDDFSNLRGQFQFNGQRMGGFGIRDVGFGSSRDQNFNERKENIKLSGSSFQREREQRESHVLNRNSFNGNNFGANSFQRLNSRDRGFQLGNEVGRNNRVSEFECDI